MVSWLLKVCRLLFEFIGCFLQFHGSYLQGHLSPAVTAKVHILNCSTNSEVVKNPNLNFHAACSYTGHVISVQGGYVEVSFTGKENAL